MNQPAYTAIDTDKWQNQLRDVVTNAHELLDLVGLSAAQVGMAPEACGYFPTRVPRSFVNRMRHGDPQDPLLRQVLASADELIPAAGYSRDPLAETGRANPRPGIIHKYRGRALLLVTGSCAINCRYCFRRHFPYEENRNSKAQWQEALQYVAEDPSIEERCVIARAMPVRSSRGSS